MSSINEWWKWRSGERFWLELSHEQSLGRNLAAPELDDRYLNAWSYELVSHVKRGDMVFHYHAGAQAIVALSMADGRPNRTEVVLPEPVTGNGGVPGTLRRRPGWTVELDRFAYLPKPVTLDEIGRTQWNLFSSLRALEDQVGDPLYYPFELAVNRVARPLNGYLFKLPELFVEAFPQLAAAARFEIAGDVEELAPALSRTMASGS